MLLDEFMHIVDKIKWINLRRDTAGVGIMFLLGILNILADITSYFNIYLFISRSLTICLIDMLVY